MPQTLRALQETNTIFVISRAPLPLFSFFLFLQWPVVHCFSAHHVSKLECVPRNFDNRKDRITDVELQKASAVILGRQHRMYVLFQLLRTN